MTALNSEMCFGGKWIYLEDIIPCEINWVRLWAWEDFGVFHSFYGSTFRENSVLQPAAVDFEFCLFTGVWLEWQWQFVCLKISAKKMQYPWLIYISTQAQSCYAQPIFVKLIVFVVHSCRTPQYVLLRQLLLEHHGLLSVCLTSACPSSSISSPAVALTYLPTRCLSVLTVRLCNLQCRPTQTAQAELKHINHSQCLQLDYKDTQSLFCLIMHKLL